MVNPRGVRLHRRFWLLVHSAVLSAGLAFLLLSAAGLHELPPPIDVRVQGSVYYIPAGTTFDQLVGRLSLAPQAGNLVDVQGQILRAAAYPGALLLDGRRQPVDVPLEAGDDIAVVNGKDRSEPLERETTRIPGGSPGNPQFFLGVAPGVQVITRGAISGKLVSSIFQPTGKAKQPPAVALTFDDGPWPTSTAKILGILDRNHVRATFFVIGYLAQRYPNLLRAEVADGMAIGNHTWDHPYHPPFRELPDPKVKQEIGMTKKLLATFGVTTSLFRPPGGTYDPEVVKVASSLGTRLVLWSVDPQDWRAGRTPKQIIHNVLANVRPGSIIELHDGGGDRSATIKALPAIIRGIRAKGLQLSVVKQ